MVMEAVRSEKPSLKALEQTLKAIRETENGDDLAVLLFMATELFADGRCRCEEKVATYGEGTAEAEACYWDVGRSRESMLEAFTAVARHLKSK